MGKKKRKEEEERKNEAAQQQLAFDAPTKYNSDMYYIKDYSEKFSNGSARKM